MVLLAAGGSPRKNTGTLVFFKGENPFTLEKHRSFFGVTALTGVFQVARGFFQGGADSAMEAKFRDRQRRLHIRLASNTNDTADMNLSSTGARLLNNKQNREHIQQCFQHRLHIQQCFQHRLHIQQCFQQIGKVGNFAPFSSFGRRRAVLLPTEAIRKVEKSKSLLKLQPIRKLEKSQIQQRFDFTTCRLFEFPTSLGDCSTFRLFDFSSFQPALAPL